MHAYAYLDNHVIPVVLRLPLWHAIVRKTLVGIRRTLAIGGNYTSGGVLLNSFCHYRKPRVKVNSLGNSDHSKYNSTHYIARED